MFDQVVVEGYGYLVVVGIGGVEVCEGGYGFFGLFVEGEGGEWVCCVGFEDVIG